MRETELEIFTEKMATKFAQKLQQARSVSDSEHHDHHTWITEKIKHERAMKDFWQQMSAHVAKWGAITLITGMGYAMWLGVRAILKANGAEH